MDWALLLVLLICPLMMLFMHGGHKGHKHGGGDKGNNHSQHDHKGHHVHHSSEGEATSNGVERLDSYKVKQLEGEVEFLKEQNELLQKKIENFSENATHKSQ